MGSDFDSEAASASVQFKSKTSLAIYSAVLILFLQMGASFWFLMDLHESGGKADEWRLLLPCGLFILMYSLMHWAHRIESRFEGPGASPDSLKTLSYLRKVLVNVGFGLICFMLFIGRRLEQGI